MGPSVEDFNDVKAQRMVPAPQLMLPGQGVPGRAVPARTVNDSGTQVVSNYQPLLRQHLIRDVI